VKGSDADLCTKEILSILHKETGGNAIVSLIILDFVTRWIQFCLYVEGKGCLDLTSINYKPKEVIDICLLNRLGNVVVSHIYQFWNGRIRNSNVIFILDESTRLLEAQYFSTGKGGKARWLRKKIKEKFQLKEEKRSE